jgi:hypothetical protein
MKNRRLTFAFVFALVLALAGWAARSSNHIASANGTAKPRAAPDIANIPRAFSYQGTLRLADGNLANGSYNITLRIYTAVTGGTALHTETFSDTVVRNGAFSVVVGDATPIAAGVFDNANLYLGITVAPDAEMLPRQRLFPVPWAMQAMEASTATALVDNATAGRLTITGTTTINNLLTINRGTGSASNGQWPGLLLTSNGDGYGSAIYLRNTNGNQNWSIHPDPSGELRFEDRNNSNTHFAINQNGTVRVAGTLSASSLGVNGNASVSSNINASGKVNKALVSVTHTSSAN